MAFQKGHPPIPGCETGGQPPKYSTEDIEKFADKFKKWLIEPSHIWFKDFCLDNDLDPDYMAEWAKANDKFGGVYRMAKHRQESRLVNGGLLNAYNSSVVKLVLGNAHGWTERQETKISGDSTNPLTFILDVIDGKSKDLVNDQDQ